MSLLGLFLGFGRAVSVYVLLLHAGASSFNTTEADHKHLETVLAVCSGLSSVCH